MKRNYNKWPSKSQKEQVLTWVGHTTDKFLQDQYVIYVKFLPVR